MPQVPQEDVIVQQLRAKWDQHAGPRVGDFCDMNDGSLRRVARVSDDSIKLAPPKNPGRFHLHDDGIMGYDGAIGVTVPRRDLVERSERHRGPCSLDLHRRNAHTTVPCRVFEIVPQLEATDG